MKCVFYSFIFIFFSVHIVFGQKKVTIDPERTSRGSLSLSDLVETIEYIQLETNEDCLIGELRNKNQVLLSENFILIHYSSASYSPKHFFYLFNRAGQFMAQIGNQGTGPGEYPQGSKPFALDEEKKQIIVATPEYYSKLIYYDLNGKYVKSVSVDKTLCNCLYHVQYDNKYVIMIKNNPFKVGSPLFNYHIFSNDYELITQKIKNVDYTTNPRGTIILDGPFCFYTYNDLLHVKIASLNDTLYSVSKNLSFYPKYIIDAGKYSINKQYLSDLNVALKNKDHIAKLQSVFETERYLLISYKYGEEKYFYQYYNKSSFQSFLFNSADGIPNDYDGGLNFWPRQQYGDMFITWYNAYLFEENVNKLKPNGSKNAVEQLQSVTNEIIKTSSKQWGESNPVIVIVKFKK